MLEFELHFGRMRVLCWYGAASPRLANITDDVWPFLFVIFLFCRESESCVRQPTQVKRWNFMRIQIITFPLPELSTHKQNGSMVMQQV